MRWMMGAVMACLMSVGGVAGAGQGNGKKDDDRKFTESFPEAAGDFASTGSNLYFILEPGYEQLLEGAEKDKKVAIKITVLDETKKIDGVECRVVRETETVDGEVHEDTRDYFAISKKTNSVYYFGEDVDVYKGGKVVGHKGSWLSGEKGAKYGLMIPGTPLVGARYYQEQAPDVGMDRSEIISLTEKFECPAGKFENCLKTEETTPLEKGSKEYKVYAPHVGVVMDGDLKLVRYGKSKK